MKNLWKGSVQAVLPVVDNEAIRLTIARYYLPSGKKTSKQKVLSQDLIVYPGEVPHKNNEQSLKEKDLKKHLGELKKQKIQNQSQKQKKKQK